MRTLHDKALDFAKARKALLDHRASMRKLRCTEAEAPDYPSGNSGQLPCPSIPNCDASDYCDNCKARESMVEALSDLRGRNDKAWARLRYEMNPRRKDATP